MIRSRGSGTRPISNSTEMEGVAYAVVREDPPRVFLASDVEVLQRVLAVELVGRLDPTGVTPGVVEDLRTALMEERWAEAVLTWMDHFEVPVDVYTHLHVHSDADFPADLVGAQLQFAPIFRGSP